MIFVVTHKANRIAVGELFDLNSRPVCAYYHSSTKLST